MSCLERLLVALRRAPALKTIRTAHRGTRTHYLLTRGEWYNFDLWYAAGDENQWDVISQPIRLETPSKIDHVFVSSTRAGGTPTAFIDCYFTGTFPGKNNNVWYGRLSLDSSN